MSKVTWSKDRPQKRFMLGAFAFYIRSQAEKKVLLLIQAQKASFKQITISREAQAQLEHFKATGELS